MPRPLRRRPKGACGLALGVAVGGNLNFAWHLSGNFCVAFKNFCVAFKQVCEKIVAFKQLCEKIVAFKRQNFGASGI